MGLLDAAAYLQIAPLVASIAERIEARLTPQNALDAWALADTHSLASLVKASKETALKHFEETMASEAWVKTPLVRIRELLFD